MSVFSLVFSLSLNCCFAFLAKNFFSSRAFPFLKMNYFAWCFRRKRKSKQTERKAFRRREFVEMIKRNKIIHFTFYSDCFTDWVALYKSIYLIQCDSRKFKQTISRFCWLNIWEIAWTASKGIYSKCLMLRVDFNFFLYKLSWKVKHLMWAFSNSQALPTSIKTRFRLSKSSL